MGEILLKLFVKNYRDTKNEKVRTEIGLVASFFGLITNFILFVMKISLGLILHLYSTLSDSINNLSDFGNNILSIFGVKASSKPADEEHPYGHQRLEYIIALIIGCVIIALGAITLYQGIVSLVSFIKSIVETDKPPKKDISYVLYIVSLSLLSFSIFLKLCQSMIYHSYGKRISSLQLIALSKDSRNDCISTFALIVGLVITWFTGYDIDCFFNIAISILIIVSGSMIIKESTTKLIGDKPDKKIVDDIVNLVSQHKDALGMHDLSLHTYGNTVYGVIHVEVDAKNDIMLSHELCDEIEKEAKEKLGINLTVHMDPILVDDPETEFFRKIVEDVIHQHSEKIHMHDFRLVSGTNSANLIFDLILPSEIDSKNKRNEIERKIIDVAQHESSKKINLVIQYDSAITDFLSGTKAEDIER